LEEAVAIAHALERNAVHPIAEAINAYAHDKRIRPLEMSDFKSVSGYGLQGIVQLNGKPLPVFIGHAAFISPQIAHENREEWEQLLLKIPRSGHLNTILLVGSTLFVVSFSRYGPPAIGRHDPHSEDRAQLAPHHVTGDHQDIAEGVAKQVGIEEIYANLRPEDKLAKVSEFSGKAGLIMVGDGINDAPALARATVGISMGKIGSATAIDASDAVFLNDNLFLLSWLTRKAHQTMHIVKQNLGLALAVILFATTPALLGLVPLWVAVILHEGGTVIVGLNSLRLLRS